MYEHLRNTFVTELLKQFNTEQVEYISNILDKVSYNYDITEKETALAVVEDDIVKIVNMYLASKNLEGRSDNTIDTYLHILKVFFRTVYKKPQDIQTNEIRLFLAQYQMQKNISDRSLDKYRQVISGFFQWCADEEYISKNPCKTIKEIKYEVEPRHSLTRYQLELVRRLCKSKRDLAIVDVLYSTGCRVTELINMKFSDIDMNNNSIHIVGKGKKHNTVYLNTNALLSLEDYIKSERKGESEYIFVKERKPYNQLSTRSIEFLFNQMNTDFKLTPHIIRHTSATLALQSGMSITQVQKMLGHSSVNTTQIYAETTDKDVAIAHKKYVV